jgi:hypothetical protein
MLSFIPGEFLMNRIPITDEWHKTEIPILKILSVTICPRLIPVEFRIKFVIQTQFDLIFVH